MECNKIFDIGKMLIEPPRGGSDKIFHVVIKIEPSIFGSLIITFNNKGLLDSFYSNSIFSNEIEVIE